MIDTYREGWTERIKYDLTHDGAPLVLTGLTLALVAYDRNRNKKVFSGTVGTADANAGTVYFDPASSDLKASESPYSISWSVTDGAGKTAFFPRESDLIWAVKR